MVSAPLLAYDPAVPGRDRLLDPAEVATRLAPLLELQAVPRAVRRRAKYRLGESLRVVYELATPRGSIIAAARAFPGHRAHEVWRAEERRCGTVRGGPGVVLDADNDAVWWVLPNDRRIVGLGELLGPSQSAREDLGLPAWCHTELVEYSPERSATVRASAVDGATLGYVKLYAPATVDVSALAARYCCVAEHLERVEGIRSPRAVRVDASRSLLLLEAMPGARWSELTGASAEEALRRLGRAIAQLHRLPVTAAAGLAPFGRLAPGRLRNSAALVARARPDIGTRLVELTDRLLESRRDGAPACFLHGDCHPQNALVDGESLSLIDLDQAGVGPAGADIGSLLARLRYGTIIGERPAADEAVLGSAFLAGYGEVATLPDDGELRWFMAAALVAERAIRAVNRVQVPALLHLDEIVAAADDASGTTGPGGS